MDWRSPWGLLGLPVALLVGMAASAPVCAVATRLENDSGFAMIFRFGVVPAFLFSGAFFPVSQLPNWIEWLAYLSPLWHGVELSRDLSLGTVEVLPGARQSRLPGGVVRRRHLVRGPRPDPEVDQLMAILAARVVPVPVRPGNGRQLVERNFLVYRRSWVVFVSGFFEPVFYLLSIGIGVAQLVGDFTLADGTVIGYAAFVAPAMLASSAMNGAIFDSTYNIFFRMKYAKLYDSMLATPLRPWDVATGEVTWALLRGACYSAMFILVMLALGLIESWWAVLALPAAVLIGYAFAGAGMALTTFMRSWQDFEFVQLATMPMFLFSATFYPVETYPGCDPLAGRDHPALPRRRARTSPHHRHGQLDAAHQRPVPRSAMGTAGMYVASRRLGKLLLK